jgi:hypothetical protein
MNTQSNELWCEHEFVVHVKRDSREETHTVSVYGDGELVEDVVIDGKNGHTIKRSTARANMRDEVEYNQYGHVIVTRHVEPGENGTVRIVEASPGTMNSERTTSKTGDGRVLTVGEKLFNAGVLLSESETHYSAEGKPCLTVTNNYSGGRVTTSEQVVWHSENRPAISESTKYDWCGMAEYQTKTMHDINGNTLWQETVNLTQPAAAKPQAPELELSRA